MFVLTITWKLRSAVLIVTEERVTSRGVTFRLLSLRKQIGLEAVEKLTEESKTSKLQKGVTDVLATGYPETLNSSNRSRARME